MAKASRKTTAIEREKARRVEPEAWLVRAERFVDRYAVVLAVALTIIGMARIALTYTVFHHTYDEPAHIACGMQWLDQGIYQYEHQHPPLTRVMAALGPYLAGVRSAHEKDMSLEGSILLFGDRHYEKTLSLARAGELPFFVLACAMVFLWGRKVLGPVGAVIAVFLFTMIPTLLAHAGLATTDIGLTATFAAATYAAVALLEKPSVLRACLFGLALGLMVLSKFSGLAFFPAAVLLAGAWWLWAQRHRLPELPRHSLAVLRLIPLPAAIAFLVVWAGYRFSWGTSTWFPFRVPFPELYSGIDEVRRHNFTGHLSYFLGEQRMTGWLMFFPVLLAVKIPAAILLLVTGALIWKAKIRDGSWPLALAWLVPAAILAVAIPANINIGLRHILPAFPFLAVLGAAGVMGLIQLTNKQTWPRIVVPALLGWLTISSVAAHPDYIPYFNLFAGEHPESIVVDSDLDWGQDIKRLGQRLRELHVPSVSFTPTVYTSFESLGFPRVVPNQPEGPAPGWNAVSLSEWKLYRLGLQMQDPQFRLWVDDAKPVEKVGKTILLFYFVPRTASNVSPPARLSPGSIFVRKRTWTTVR